MDASRSDVAKLTAEAARHYNVNDFPAAEALAQQILAIDPQNLIGLRITGVARRKAGDFDSSISWLTKGIGLHPENAILWFELAANYIELLNHREAYDCLTRCIQLAPHFQPAYVNLGGVLEQQERYEEALYYARRAYELKPDCSMANYNLSNALRETGNIEEAISAGERAAALDPNYAKADWNLGICHLLLGNYQEGWQRYEGREEAGEVFIDRYTEPRWDGSSLAGKTIIVHGEQGVGDEILFASCLPELVPLAENVILTCDPRLKHLFARSFPSIKVYGFARMKDWSPAVIPETFDVQIPAGSLPFFLRPTAESFPRRRQFLLPDPAARARWRDCFAALGPGLKVGISWRAGGKAAERRKRSIEVEQWAPILTVPGVHFINLQYSDSSQDFAAAAEEFGVNIHDWEDGDPLVDMDSYAARIAALDLVISVGNATVHMAGAVGTPAWAMLPMIPSWRWMVRGDESPWYKSVRVLRQSQRGQWQPVLERIGDMLSEKAGSQRPMTSAVAHTTSADAEVIEVARPTQWLDTKEMNQRIDANRLKQSVDEALDHTEKGNLAIAEQLFRDVIQIAPRHVRALHGLGIVALKTGRPELAIRSFKRSIAMVDLYPEYHCDLATALTAVGRFDEAVRCYHHALEKDPDLVRAANELSELQQRLGVAPAKAHLETRDIGSRLSPAMQYVQQAHSEMASCQLDEAIASFRRAIQLGPTLAAAHAGLAQCLLEDQCYEGAESALHEAIRLEPETVDHYRLLGRVLRRADRRAEALHMLEQAADIDPKCTATLIELAHVERELGQLPAAIQHFESAIALAPENAETQTALGAALQQQGNLSAAETHYSSAIGLSPNFAAAHLNRGLVLLQQGKFEEGWREYEWRWDCGDTARRRNFFPWPTWDGDSLTGKSLLVHAEQGIGDEIMFASCYREVIAQADEVVILAEPRLERLLGRGFPEAKVLGVPRGREHQWKPPAGIRIDVQIAAGSLPSYLRRNRSDFPIRSHYLIADPANVQKWRGRFALLGAGPKIGISWRAGERADDAARRSIPLGLWAQLLALENVHFVNLQHGNCSDEITQLSKTGGVLHHWADADNRSDLDGLAARIAALDLVITVGNSVAHLSGALGTLTWTLLPRTLGWRWLADEQQTPWYSTVQLYRQEEPEQWEPLLARVRQDLLNHYSRPDEVKPMHGIPRPHWMAQSSRAHVRSAS